MSDFKAAVAVVFEHEGGYVDNPSDRGGATNFGVTQWMLNNYCSKNHLPLYSVEHLERETAEEIYRENFWDELQLDAVTDQTLATVLLDLSVLRGVPAVVRTLQMALKRMGAAVFLDGVMGAQTAIALQSCLKPKELALGILLDTQLLLTHVAIKGENQLQFLPGWLARTQELLRRVCS